MPHERDGGWDPGRIETLRALWAADIPTAAIAARIGTTKNAVIGKAHRLGLPPRPHAIRPAAIRPPRGGTPASRLAAAVGRPAASRPAATVAPVPRSAPEPDLATPPPVAREERTPAPAEASGGHACRWPLGDPRERGFRFCGAPATPGRSYCGPHLRRAYVFLAERVA